MTVAALLDMDFFETSLRHEFVTNSLRREGPIDCWDFSLIQLSLIGQDGGVKFLPFFMEVAPK